MTKLLLSASAFVVVLAGEVRSQSVYFGQGCSIARQPAFSAGWAGGGWQVAASWRGGGWGGGYSAAPACLPYVRPVVVPVWTGGFNCFPAPVVNYYGTTSGSSPAFVVPRRYGAAPIVADPVFRAGAPIAPARTVRVAR
jgi:hypothetical protein